ncbi:putative PTH2 family peptidyl-tRNA hydrolase [Rosellinia necatrix]|uniref:peptidyl-tRNA hydrolase n=1 Tax=Rosellinia necatrix TaxID=77044 RepID=A0A1W2TCL4_ROSNE|nr:putative PTH2 family peptidyl-tRNA hydrolase [Rosellinia necatrix]
MSEPSTTSTVIITTSLVAFFSGFALGIYSIRGYLLPPTLRSAREQRLNDPVESDESDIDEDDTILDHAPNWANGAEADRRQGLRLVEAEAGPEQKKGKKKQKGKGRGNETRDDAELNDDEAQSRGAKQEAEAAHPGQAAVNLGSSSNEECKLVLVVRTDLGMTKGKIAAQCSHATLACYKALSRSASRQPTSAEAKILQRWERLGQAKIAVQVKSQDELLTLMGKARSLGVTAEVIQDAGRTQIDPGSLTVLGVGPAPKSVVDQITGGLKLL